MTAAWTFVLAGEVRSGAGVVASSVTNRGKAVCHAGLFHPDAAVRRAVHEAYFGESPDPVRLPTWLVEPGGPAPATNPWQYITQTVLRPQHDEEAVGFYLPYAALRRYDLYDLFEQLAVEGGFSVVQVVRNPVACFVSRKQAEQTGVWCRPAAQRAGGHPPTPIRVDPAELTAFCRDHGATVTKLRAVCRDRLEVSYRDVALDYQAAMRRVFDHIELPDAPVLARPAYRRLRNRPVPDRVTNWAELRAVVPSDVRALMDADDLF